MRNETLTFEKVIKTFCTIANKPFRCADTPSDSSCVPRLKSEKKLANNLQMCYTCSNKKADESCSSHRLK